MWANSGRMPVGLVESSEACGDGATYCPITQSAKFVFLSDIFVCNVGRRVLAFSVGDIFILGATLSVFARLLFLPFFL